MVLETIKGRLNTEPEEKVNTEDAVIPTDEYREVLLEVSHSIELGGYNPVSQIVGFVLSEDPTHVANYGNARNLIGKIDRDTLLEDMVRYYLKTSENENN